MISLRAQFQREVKQIFVVFKDIRINKGRSERSEIIILFVFTQILTTKASNVMYICSYETISSKLIHVIPHSETDVPIEGTAKGLRLSFMQCAYIQRVRHKYTSWLRYFGTWLLAL